MMLHVYLHLALVASGTLAQELRRRSGFVGYGINAMDPFCAFACRDSISGATLSCSQVMSDDMGGMSGMSSMVMTEPDCFATNDAFLQTLAWCVQSHCKDISTWKLEQFWKENVAGTYAHQPDPKYTYQTALAKSNGAPTTVYNETGWLNDTSIVSEDLWFTAYNTDTIFIRQESQQEGFGLIILLSGVIIPIAFSLLRFVPFPGTWRSKFNAHVIDPPLWGHKHDTPVFFGLAQIPKRGQALLIFYFIVINTVLSAVNYEYANPNTWYPDDRYRWMCMLISNRIGLLSFANLPLVFLYAGRNNILLWITNWSHSTFLLLHRWIAAIATLQAILHSIIYLYVYVKARTHSSESKLPYWYWGIIGTLGLTILFPLSVLPIRKRFYELFLAWHVVISILIIVGCYYHIIFEFAHQWGYETWIWICMAIWGFDRVLRLLRLIRYGVRRAEITAIDDEYIRVTITDIITSGHAYLYFPTLTWRIWENHPFSVASTVLSSSFSPIQKTSRTDKDIEKQPKIISSSVHGVSDTNSQASSPSRSLGEPPQAGITFYIRTQTGLTSRLRGHSSVPVLIEAGYTSHSLVAESLHNSTTLVALAGGVGITAVLPHVRTHPGRSKLYWGCRTQALVNDVKGTGLLAGVEQEFFVGKRMVIREILENELAHGTRGEVCVLVSGPDTMIDEVRNSVGGIVKKGNRIKVRLEVESFGW